MYIYIYIYMQRGAIEDLADDDFDEEILSLHICMNDICVCSCPCVCVCL